MGFFLTAANYRDTGVLKLQNFDLPEGARQSLHRQGRGSVAQRSGQQFHPPEEEEHEALYSPIGALLDVFLAFQCSFHNLAKVQ